MRLPHLQVRTFFGGGAYFLGGSFCSPPLPPTSPNVQMWESHVICPGLFLLPAIPTYKPSRVWCGNHMWSTQYCFCALFHFSIGFFLHPAIPTYKPSRVRCGSHSKPLRLFDCHQLQICCTHSSIYYIHIYTNICPSEAYHEPPKFWSKPSRSILCVRNDLSGWWGPWRQGGNGETESQFRRPRCFCTT